MEQKKYPIETVRHSLSHVLAMAVVDMFPEVKLGIGPAIDTGFYYDFELPMALSAEDLPKLEKKMREIINSGASFKASKLVSRSASKQFENQPYKVELIKDLEASGETEVSIYQSGDFVDLCAGPHVESTKDLKGAGWKLDKIAGAYWKGSEKNSMMTRIYGLAFESREGIEQYLKNREEAEKRDHRKLGRELDLFHIDEEVGLGLVLWHPRGAIIWRVIEDFWYKEHLKNGYQLVRSPHIGNRRLWEKSGHWGFYNSSMYPPMEAGQSLEDRQLERKVEKSEEYLLKPMNCPFHVQIYKNSPHSY
ncbi:MAG: threonine--tRNA ligase, partial [Patescibacteria group bacterium]